MRSGLLRLSRKPVQETKGIRRGVDKVRVTQVTSERPETMSAPMTISEEVTSAAQKVLEAQPTLESTLKRYADELGVSLEHVVMGSLMTVAEEYQRSTGNGQIPCLY